MKKSLFVVALPLLLGTVACHKNAAVPAEAQNTADVLTGDAAGSADSNPLCKLFTVDEIATYEGAPVAAGKNAAMGTGCQWVHAQGEGSAMVQVVRKDDFSAPDQAPGYKVVPGAGEQAFVVPQMGGWQAGAIQHEKAVMVMTGGSSSEAKAVDLLKEAMKRAH